MERKIDKEMIGQWVKMILLGLLALVLLIIAVLEILPSPNAGLKTKTAFSASSQKIRADGTLYSTEIRGVLRNGGDDPIRVDEVRVVVGDGRNKARYELEGTVLPQNAEREFVLLLESACNFDTVYEVSAVVGGNEYRLVNRSSTEFPISGLAIGCAALLIPAVFFTVRAVQGYLYLLEERKNFG